ncbi:MAG: CDGSH iron-sulfur domain-containing protein [Thermoplasmata archaeon]|nr:MAG: CDGSH iron-sulfur domain-containing protein [Thermoplasmata archaeon]
MSKDNKIKITKDGPYIVKNAIPLMKMKIVVNSEGDGIDWKIGKKYPLQKNIALCRCGESRNKPYCDGTHEKIDFDGTETADKSPYLDLALVYDGPTLKLTDVEEICAASRFCAPEGGTWELTERSDDPKARKLAIQQTANCPSGRLAIWENETGEEIEPELKPSLGLVEDPHKNASGPICVRGKVPIESADGFTYEIRNRVTLCRCGKSSNKPFCDASHLD